MEQSRLKLAVIGSLILNVATVPLFFVLPTDEDTPAAVIVIGFIVAAVAIVGAYGLWQRQRWGWWVTFITTAFNIVSSVPAIFVWPSTAVGISVIVLIVLGIALLVLLRKPEIRQQLA